MKMLKYLLYPLFFIVFLKWVVYSQCVYTEANEDLQKNIDSYIMQKKLGKNGHMLNRTEIDAYHENGYIIMRYVFTRKTLDVLQGCVDHVTHNPNWLLKSAEPTRFCGFALHIQELFPAWRDVAYSLHTKRAAQ